MAKCNKTHLRKNGDKPSVVIPCHYVAGICIVDPIHEGGLKSFLVATYPYYHGKTYEQSKHQQPTLVPDLVSAHMNVG